MFVVNGFYQIASDNVHKARVMGLYYEYITGYLYSIGEDKFFKVYDVSQKGIIAGIYPSKFFPLF